MAADDARSIAEEIDNNPDAVGVTPAEERESDVDAPAQSEDARPTWGDVWEFYDDDTDWEFPKVLSPCQWKTALAGHPDVSSRTVGDAADAFKRAKGGALVESRPGSDRWTITQEADDEYV